MPRKMIVLRISCRYDTYIKISVISYRSFPFDFITSVWRRMQSKGGRDCNHQSLTCITILRLRKPFVYQSFEFTLAANWFVVICVKRKRLFAVQNFFYVDMTINISNTSTIDIDMLRKNI